MRNMCYNSCMFIADKQLEHLFVFIVLLGILGWVVSRE
jgi:hypothetical protein